MKNKRQDKILELIKNNIIVTQEDLQSELEALGYNVTQSTVSRDIKELRIVKGHDINGNYRYVSSDTNPAISVQSLDHYKEMFSKSVKNIDYSLNNVVIKCFTGMASSTCVAVDAMYGDMMLGSLAGDDTIIAVTRSESESQTLVGELQKLL